MIVLKTTAHKQLIFTSKWAIVWHYGMQDALLNTHCQSFDSPLLSNYTIALHRKIQDHGSHEIHNCTTP